MSVPHTLLRLLMEGPTHGYELRQKLSAFRHFYPLSNVNVYPVLKDLEEQGLVTSHNELADSRMRKIYEITAKGVAEFEHWIEMAPEVSLPVETDLIALKLVLAPRRDGAGLGWLSRSLAELDDEIVGWRAYIEASRSVLPRLALLTAEYRMRCHEHRRNYLAEANAITLATGQEEGETRILRILVADDSLASRALSRHLLSAAGYEVQLAEDGAQAWELLQERVFDVLVSDALMPELDGFELLRRVRASRQLSELPVILNTVLDESEEREAALAAGANDFVCKSCAESGRRLVDSVDRVTGTGTGNGAR
jgi:CheY-like chemotaxis protein/DNA-binding PadR family transcriptional regulator